MPDLLVERGVTRKEAEVLSALGEHLSNAEIASRLYVSERTVESHVSSLLRKLQVSNRRELARVAAATADDAKGKPPMLPPMLQLAVESRPIAGRRAELDRLRELWQRAQAGGPLVAVVAGEAGIGKSRLVAELAIEVHRTGSPVLFGSCFEDDQTPYLPFVQIIAGDVDGISDSEKSRRLAGDARVLGRLLPALSPQAGEVVVDASSERAELISAVHCYVRRLCESAPTLLVLEDLHWATATTRDTLRHIARASDRAPLLLVATTRDVPPDVSDELAIFLGELCRYPSVTHVVLHGLDETAIRELIAADVERTRLDVATICAQTGGNPLLVSEMVARGGSYPRVGSSVRTLLSVRSRRLNRDDNLILDLAAVVGAEFDVDLLAVASETSLIELLDALERTEAVGLTKSMPGRPGRFAFVHALFRTVRYEALPTNRRLRLHRRVADALEQMFGDDDAVVGELARHSCTAMPVGDATLAIRYAMRAGELAMQALAMDEAAGHYRRALSIADVVQPRDETLSCQLTARLGEVLVELEDPEGFSVLERAADAARRLGDVDLLASIAWAMCPYQLMVGQHNPVALSLAEDALARLGPEPTATRARLLTVAAAHSEGLAAPVQRHVLFEEAVTAARAAHDPVALGHVLTYQLSRWDPDNLSERVAAASELAVLAERLSQPIFALVAHDQQFSNLLESGDVAAALAEADAFEATIGKRSDDFGLSAIIVRRATRLYLAGALSVAEQAAGDLLRLAQQRAALRGLNPVNLYAPYLMVIRFAQGRFGELIPLIRHAYEANPAVVAYQAALAMALARSGDVDEARDIVRHLTIDDVEALPRQFQWYSGMICLADAACVTGDHDATTTLFEQLEPYAGRFAVHGSAVSLPVDIALAQLALARGDHDWAATTAARTVHASRCDGTPIFLGLALVQAAAASVGTGCKLHEVQQIIDEALEIAHRTGAAFIEQEAARLGLDGR